MNCIHCKKRVEDALNAIDGVKAEVSLKKNAAEISLSKDVKDETLKKAVEEAGYQIIPEGK
jgi:copper chaperone CopZ